jgi:hypothetical protein
MPTPPPGRVSPFELELQNFLWKLPGRVSFVVNFEGHGRRESEPPRPTDVHAWPPVSDEAVTGGAVPGEAIPDGASPDEAVAGEAVDSRAAAFSDLLETGAGHLVEARSAFQEQCRQAARQARALAAFAAQRPATALDRPDDEVGAAAAASRAARPAVLTAVSEWAVDEVMVALGLSSDAAVKLLEQSVTVVQQLPETLAALEAATISWPHAVMLADVLPSLTDPAKRAEVEAWVLGRAAGKTVPQLRAAARRAVLRADASAAARRLATAIRNREVRVFPGEDGIASLTASMATPVALACRKALESYAEDCVTPGDERSKHQRMVDCLVDLILRPGATGEPPVRIDLTVVAGVDTLIGGEEPGEIDGQPVPAIVVRELAYALGLLPRPLAVEREATQEKPADISAEPPRAESRSGTEPQGGAEPRGSTEPRAAEPENAERDNAARDNAARENAAPENAERGNAERENAAPQATEPEKVEPESPELKSIGREATGTTVEPSTVQPAPPLARNRGGAEAAELARLLGIRTIAGTPLAHLPTIAVIDEISGQLLALTDATEVRRQATCGRVACRTARRTCGHPPTGSGIGPPPATERYGPSTALQGFVRARDRRCRFPGCRAAAIRCDLDHNVPWPAGATSAGNLCCLCRHHHRLSHQAPGWTMRRLPDGGLEWTTPGGDRITTYPLRYGTDDDLPPPPSPADPPPSPAGPPSSPPTAGQPPSRHLTLRERVLGSPATPEERRNDPPPF